MISSRTSLTPAVQLAPATVVDGDGGSHPGSVQSVLVVDDDASFATCSLSTSSAMGSARSRRQTAGRRATASHAKHRAS